MTWSQTTAHVGMVIWILLVSVATVQAGGQDRSAVDEQAGQGADGDGITESFDPTQSIRIYEDTPGGRIKSSKS